MLPLVFLFKPCPVEGQETRIHGPFIVVDKIFSRGCVGSHTQDLGSLASGMRRMKRSSLGLIATVSGSGLWRLDIFKPRCLGTVGIVMSAYGSESGGHIMLNAKRTMPQIRDPKVHTWCCRIPNARMSAQSARRNAAEWRQRRIAQSVQCLVFLFGDESQGKWWVLEKQILVKAP